MAEPCQVDFYVLADADQSAERLACRLALMAWEQGYTAMLLTGSEQQARQIDDLLWESPPDRFLPHGRAGDDGPEAVTVGTADELTAGCGDVIINLSPDPVPEPGRFRRLLEFVPANDRERRRSREKFRHYRDQGLEPASHSIGRQ
ncbi:DNA polymerase III subunit chi [Elongatibacter sediminis]|uniref:DNA polymerase III subunit chi n=1 Tax=Elongatibacter sediminis TaxID=3119006 RepID=A0AAW9RB63_9GAMM